MKLANRNPTGGVLLELTGTKLVIAFAGNFVLGMLMTLGIGLYAPCMIMIYLLGMDPKAAFPIMMGSCAFLMPVASARFIRERSFDLRASLGLLRRRHSRGAHRGVHREVVAASVVGPLVVVVVLYAAFGLLRAAQREKAERSPRRRRRPGRQPARAVPENPSSGRLLKGQPRS